MCQRVLIAMAFASNPRLVVADEPTTALDVTDAGRAIIKPDRRDAAARRHAVIFITHDLRLAAQICDEILVMYAGARSSAARPAQLFSQPGASLHAMPATGQPDA